MNHIAHSRRPLLPYFPEHHAAGQGSDLGDEALLAAWTGKLPVIPNSIY